jgi:hypothetical protein
MEKSAQWRGRARSLLRRPGVVYAGGAESGGWRAPKCRQNREVRLYGSGQYPFCRQPSRRNTAPVLARAGASHFKAPPARFHMQLLAVSLADVPIYIAKPALNGVAKAGRGAPDRGGAGVVRRGAATGMGGPPQKAAAIQGLAANSG